MRFDARNNPDPVAKQAFIEWLSGETVSGLQRGPDDRESFRGVVFLYLNRAYEAHLDPDLITDLFGVSPGNVLSRAGMSKAAEAMALEAFAELDAMVEQTWART